MAFDINWVYLGIDSDIEIVEENSPQAFLFSCGIKAPNISHQGPISRKIMSVIPIIILQPPQILKMSTF